MNDKPAVELHPAYVWDCSECGRENWQRSVSRTIPLTEDQIHEDAVEEFGEDDPEMIEKMLGMEMMIRTCPSNVVCVHCKNEFAVALEYDPGDDFDDDDDMEDDE